MTQRYPMGQPNGWYHVAFSDELAPGVVRPAQFFGRPLVLFRTAAGRPALLDAYCPHLGAHLGHGGTIEGETIACPFHSWRFDADGVCTEVPYARTAPRQVGRQCIKSWPVRETNRSIYAWYHGRSAAPAYDVVSLPQLAPGNTAWGPFTSKQWIVRCHIQECQENIIDTAHFKYVHGLDPRIDLVFDGHRSRVTMVTELPGMPAPSSTTTHHNGPGQTWSVYDGFPEIVMLNPVTPLDDERVLVNVAVAFSQQTLAGVPEAILKDVIAQMFAQVDRDIPIFEHKVYRAAPPLCDGDGPIAEFREWYRQFYAA